MVGECFVFDYVVFVGLGDVGGDVVIGVGGVVFGLVVVVV